MRIVNLSDRVLILVDGRMNREVLGFWPPARVGLVSEGMKASFDGVTCFRINP